MWQAMRFLAPPIVLTILSLACASSPSSQSEPVGNVLATTIDAHGIEAGPGADYCVDFDLVHQDLSNGRWQDAQASLNYMLSQFSRFETPGMRVLSFASQAEYEMYLETANDSDSIVPVDWCYRELFQLKAFIHAAQENFEAALGLLSRSAEVGPTAAGPYVERGYIFNRLGRFTDARDSYEIALALVSRYPSSRPHEPMALRGLGFALIELGDLEGAEAAFRRSLDVDPNNDLAKSELKYIRGLRQEGD